MQRLQFDVVTKEGTEKLEVGIKRLYIAGFAGRDIKKTMAHIEELAVMGVARPKSVPSYYANGTNLLVQEEEIQIVGKGSSGEVEFIVMRIDGELYVGIGSDHSDRELEALDVPKAKQVCPKPIGKTLWKYSEVKDHWDTLVMESWQIIDGEKVLYQKGTAADLLPLETLLNGAKENLNTDLEDELMFTGTVAALNGIKEGSHFWGKITDEVIGRTLEFDYEVNVIG